eukprot:COSAG02_NODE_21732_length_777_cov_0.839233_3_plen_50_part_01
MYGIYLTAAGFGLATPGLQPKFFVCSFLKCSNAFCIQAYTTCTHAAAWAK